MEEAKYTCPSEEDKEENGEGGGKRMGRLGWAANALHVEKSWPEVKRKGDANSLGTTGTK